MRKLSWMMLAAGLVLSTASAHAQSYDPNYPVCMTVYANTWGGGEQQHDCTFTSIPQCQASASGRAATCGVNPYYAPEYRTAPAPLHRRHRHAY